MCGPDRIPKELDWVTERANCTAYLVFKRLQVEVEDDVRLRQSKIATNMLQLTFRFDVVNETTFSVVREGIGIVDMVQFRLDHERIVVRDDKNRDVMSAGLTLNDAGECVLRLTDWTDGDSSKTAELRT